MTMRSAEQAAVGWTTYVDDRRGFALDHPSDWKVQRGMSGLLVSVFAPEPKDADFRSNMNLVRRVRDNQLDLDDLAKSAVSSLTRLLNEAIVIDVDSVVVAQHPARRLLVAYRQGIYALTSEQWMLLTDEHIWTISTGTLTERWDQEAEIFDRIARSFSLDQAP